MRAGVMLLIVVIQYREPRERKGMRDYSAAAFGEGARFERGALLQLEALEYNYLHREIAVDRQQKERSTHEHKMCTTLWPRYIEIGYTLGHYEMK